MHYSSGLLLVEMGVTRNLPFYLCCCQEGWCYVRIVIVSTIFITSVCLITHLIIPSVFCLDLDRVKTKKNCECTMFI